MFTLPPIVLEWELHWMTYNDTTKRIFIFIYVKHQEISHLSVCQAVIQSKQETCATKKWTRLSE